MLKNRPLDIPEVQFCKLIRYWNLPSIKNTEKRSKQTCPHRMGSTNFGVVWKELHEAKENNEEHQPWLKCSGKLAKNEIQHRIEAADNDEDALIAVLGKDQPGRLPCYGGAITK
ncbi:hypothetical protein PIB30_060653 [Stylosanthes scabra]|uniref:Uncharacterized protein n=1 Tax=Stylosanthes scabra TaxID=79078 RepID=A0ABU6UL56_9FABA|nr:hypothetical protein [Stylosanthes scabra]